MSISEEATNLIDNFEYAVEDAVSDYTMACGASQKHQARHNLEDYIAELEAEHEKVFDLVRKLRMYCIWAKWDNPDTEYEFNEFDEEVCNWLSKFMEREA